MNPKDINQDEIARMLAQTGGEVRQFIQSQKELTDELRVRMLELEQKGAQRRTGGDAGGGSGDITQLTGLIADSEGLKSFIAGNTQSCSIKVPSRYLKTQIINATGVEQPLVAPDRRPGIVTAPQQRLTIRALFQQLPTASNLVEFTSEATFTSNARPQGDVSPGNIEGELKAESGMTFILTNTPVVTLAHWIPASRQVLADAPMLQAHVSGRLLYGLALEEEHEILTGDGTAGKLTGLTAKATEFTGGVTNATALDTLARAITQLAVGNYEPSGIILNPSDWLAIRLLKTTQGEYLIGDPQSAASPMLWGLPVVPTPSMTAGKFLVLDAQRTGFIADREDATVRISENVNDHFVRNMVAILAEERLAMVIENGSAMVYGDLSYAG